MESFRYKARDEKGKMISGVMQANNEVDLHEKLKAENKLLIDFFAFIFEYFYYFGNCNHTNFS